MLPYYFILQPLGLPLLNQQPLFFLLQLLLYLLIFLKCLLVILGSLFINLGLLTLLDFIRRIKHHPTVINSGLLKYRLCTFTVLLLVLKSSLKAGDLVPQQYIFRLCCLPLSNKLQHPFLYRDFTTSIYYLIYPFPISQCKY